MKKPIILLILICCSCDREPGITIQLVETTTKSGICFDHGIKETTTSTKETLLSATEFSIGLKLKTKPDQYIAMKTVSCCLEMCSVSKIDAIMVITELFIVDENNKPKPFNTRNEFLEYMADGNYELVNKENTTGNSIYKFQKIVF